MCKNLYSFLEHYVDLSASNTSSLGPVHTKSAAVDTSTCYKVASCYIVACDIVARAGVDDFVARCDFVAGACVRDTTVTIGLVIWMIRYIRKTKLL